MDFWIVKKATQSSELLYSYTTGSDKEKKKCYISYKLKLLFILQHILDGIKLLIMLQKHNFITHVLHK